MGGNRTRIQASPVLPFSTCMINFGIIFNVRLIASDMNDFPSLHRDGKICVDKTEYVHRMVSAANTRLFFISRPAQRTCFGGNFNLCVTFHDPACIRGTRPRDGFHCGLRGLSLLATRRGGIPRLVHEVRRVRIAPLGTPRDGAGRTTVRTRHGIE